MERRGLDAGSNQVDDDEDEGTDKDEFKDFPHTLAVEKRLYAMKEAHCFFSFIVRIII